LKFIETPVFTKDVQGLLSEEDLTPAQTKKLTRLVRKELG
jgi:hypothetical protein